MKDVWEMYRAISLVRKDTEVHRAATMHCTLIGTAQPRRNNCQPLHPLTRIFGITASHWTQTMTATWWSLLSSLQLALRLAAVAVLRVVP